jgi:hypothetical protein
VEPGCGVDAAEADDADTAAEALGESYVNAWSSLLAESDGQAGGWRLSVLDRFKRERRNMTAPEDKHRVRHRHHRPGQPPLKAQAFAKARRALGVVSSGLKSVMRTRRRSVR